MKKLLLSFAVVLTIASVFAFASTDPVRPVSKNTKVAPCTFQFIFTGTPSQTFDPLKYATTTNFTPCAGTTFVCGLCFSSSSLVYTVAESPTKAGKPKVDQTILNAAITAALTQPSPKSNPYIYTDPGTGITIEVWLKTTA